MNLKPVKAYLAWFLPDSEDKESPRYRVYISESQQPPTLYSATIIRMNTDTPVPSEAGEQFFWNQASIDSLDGLRKQVDMQLCVINPGKKINYSEEHWIEKR
ncbi:MAG: hypothetical protein ACLQU2_28365 [Candidatus Binataceae bacterium]